MDLAVIRLDRTRTDNRGNRQRFTMGKDPIAVTGLQMLIQAITVMMLSAPGSDALAPEDGVGLVELTRRAVASAEDLRTDAVIAYSMLKKRTMELQAGQDMPTTERLENLEVVRIYPDGQRFVHVLRVTSAAGDSVTIDTKDLFLE
jgi:hypothetical protein